MEKELQKDKDWIVVDLNSTQNLLDDFAMRLVDSCKEFTDILKKGFNVSVAGFGVGINGENQNRSSVSIINEILGSIPYTPFNFSSHSPKFIVDILV